MTRSFPLALNLSGRKCLVIGSSAEAAARARALADADADLHLIAERPCVELVQLIRERNLRHHERGYLPSDMAGTWLAVLTARDFELAARIARDAHAARVFFCAVDVPEHGSFSHMAIARAGVVSLAIATEGRAPALARRLREELQRVMNEADLASFADTLAELREQTPSPTRQSVLGAAVSQVRLEGKLRLGRD